MLCSFLKRKLLTQRKIIKPLLQISKSYQEINIKFLQTKYLFKMNEAFVRYNSSNERFNISFHYTNKDLLVDRQYNFNRQINEPIENFLKRIDTSVTKTSKIKKERKNKKAQKKGIVQTDETEGIVDNVASNKIKILKNDQKVDNSTTCKEILEDASNTTLEILGIKFTLNINAPWIDSIHLPPLIMSGFPVYPIKLETFQMNKEDSVFTWYKEDKTKSATSVDYWKKVGEGFMYMPKNEDVSLKLKLVCEPRFGDKSGPETEIVSSNCVQAGPGTCPFETRHAFTTEKLSGKNFRVMSYNLLANAYADSDYSRETLFPYCPNYALDIDYRKKLFIKEILGFNSDIVCLQEVDYKVFENDLIPCLNIEYYNGIFTKKGIELSEGLAIFYNSKRFHVLYTDIIVMSKNVDIEPFNNIWSKLTNEKTKERFLARNTTVQAIVLKSLENPDIFVVGNTHLYFHPDADHIRLLQGYYVLTYIQSIVKKTKEENPNCNVHMILCGDFNSIPECGIYQLYTQNYVSHDFVDWSSNFQEKVENVSLSHDYKIGSACGTPKYTNYTVEFNGCLDYIFYETNNLKVTQVVPMPSDEDIQLYTAIPSVVFPSDHISICADLEIV